MANAIFERSGGRLLIDVYPVTALGYSGFTHHRVAGEGLIEMGEAISAAAREVGVFGVFSHVLLFENAEDSIIGWDIAKPLLDKGAASFNTKLLAAVMRPLDVIHSTKKPFPTLDSMKGIKIRAWNDLIASWLTEIGAVPVVIPYAERYTALATGVVDANFASPVSQIDTKDYEVAPWTNLWPVTVPIYTTFVNLDAFNALPKDLQDILLEEGAKMEADVRAELLGTAQPSLDKLEGFGVTIVEVAPAELEKGRLAGELVQARWLETAGPEANELIIKVKEALGY